jgi:hypothetical protein
VELGQFNDAWRRIGEMMTAVQTTKESWWEADLHRIAGEVALKSPEPDAAKAVAYFERALAIARQQQAKSWELRAAMSMARHWRDQGKARQASELLAPVYGWFTEGFDTRDLKEAKALLEELAATMRHGISSDRTTKNARGSIASRRCSTLFLTKRRVGRKSSFRNVRTRVVMTTKPRCTAGILSPRDSDSVAICTDVL